MPRAKSDPIDKEIGRLIRQHRERLDLKQHDVAVPLNVTAQQIGKYERGEDQMKVGVLMGLATLFGVRITELVPDAATGFAESETPEYVVRPPLSSILSDLRREMMAALDKADEQVAAQGFPVRDPGRD